LPAVARRPERVPGAAARASRRDVRAPDRQPRVGLPALPDQARPLPALAPALRSAGAVARVGGMAPLRAVVFDVDFTISEPGPDLGPEGYRQLGLRYGLTLDPARHDEARRAALETIERHPELDHDEETWILFTERIIQGMGGVGDTHGAAVEMTRAWENADHFDLYPDVAATLEELRAHGLKIGLLSNTARDLELF